jgi:hypothetical protein
MFSAVIITAINNYPPISFPAAVSIDERMLIHCHSLAFNKKVNDDAIVTKTNSFFVESVTFID